MLLSSCISAPQRRRARLLAYVSTWTGNMSEVLFDSSAIVLLFITAQGGGGGMAMLSSALSPAAWALLLVPCSELARKKGLKWTLSAGVYLAMAGILVLVLSPYCGRAALGIALAGCAVFALSRPVHLAAWNPLLNGILRREERGKFFGFMRFSYQLAGIILFSSAGFLMGEKPPLWLLQSIIGLCGLLLIGRKLCLDRIPAARSASAAESSFAAQIRRTLRNGMLTGFSVYSCGLIFTATASLPLTVLYLKHGVRLNAGTIQLIAVVGTAGTMLGYLLFGTLLERLGIRVLILFCHISMIVFNTALAFCTPQFSFTPAACAVLLFGMSFSTATFANCFSTELLALAKPGQYTTAMALGTSYRHLGDAAGRLFATIVLGSGILAANWQAGGLAFTRYQSLEFICAATGLLLLIALPTVPAIVPRREDYYEGAR